MGKWVLVLFWCGITNGVVAQERLILVGGGEMPPQACERFVAWGGGTKARILLIEWASGIPEESDTLLRDSFLPYHPASIETAPLAFDHPKKKEFFLQQLDRSTAVFFGGGDQNRVMDLLETNPDLLLALRKTFERAVFGGTSAGTAIMSATMITGEGDFTVIDPAKVGTRPGLGFVRDVIVDQHFIKRMRSNRLLSVLSKSPERWGLGIDEGTAVAFENNSSGEVLGPNPVMLFDNRSAPGKFLLEIIPPGGKFNLQ